MIHLDLREVKSLQKLEMFNRILGQLTNQAGIYDQRETIGTEPGYELFMGDHMNIYVDYASTQLWILVKPRIDG